MRPFGLALVLCVLAACASDSANPSTPTEPSTTPAQPTMSGPAAAPAVSGASMQPAQGAATTPPAAASQPPAAGTAQIMPAQPPAQPGAMQPSMMGTNGQPQKKLAMDECGLHTQYAGDEYCIKPPPPEKGFQVHWGPSNYDHPESTYLLQPGAEDVITLSQTSGNAMDINYYWRQYRMRPGSHHVIFTTNGRRLGGTQNLAKDNPDFGIIPPENADVGLPLAAHSPISANMHFYNVTEKPMLREIWVNFWYKNAAEVKERAIEVFSMTSVTAATAHSHVVVGASCSIQGSGRVLSLYGHRHMSSVRFSTWLTSGGKKQLILEDYDPMHPAAFDYNSLAMNPTIDPKTKTAGASSGILNLKQGDTLDFECEIVNNTDKNFVGANEANDDEMCILVGDSVGATVSPLCNAIPARRVN